MTGTSHAIYLASRSPRRRELLRQIGIAFEVLLLREAPQRERDVDETPLPGELPEAYVKRVTTEKSRVATLRAGQRRLPPRLVLTADTTVALGSRIFGKPADADDAAAMLRALSGTRHEVYTAVALRFGGRFEVALSVSTVDFAELSDAAIRRYCATGEPLDKAGAYAVQGRAAAFVRRIEGSYSGIMGLPLHETAVLMQKFGQAEP